MTGRFPGFAIDPDIGQDFVERAAPRANKDRVTLPAGRDERVFAIGSDPDRRVRFMVGLWYDADIFVIVEFAGERKRFLRPGAFDDFEHFGKTLRTLAIRDAVGLVSAREAAASDAKDQPSMADVIDGCGVFGEPQRLA